MAVKSRRDLLKSGAALGAGLVTGRVMKPGVSHAQSSCASCAAENFQSSGQTSKWDHEYTFGHTKLFMENYYEGVMEILGCQSAKIEQIADIGQVVREVER